MEANARAGIDLFGSVLRYAEVEQYGSRYRLLRLGSCDFDFDVTDVLWRGASAAELASTSDTVAEALSDVFAGSVATSFQVTVHPPGCYSFFSALPAGISDAARKVRLQQETALVAGVETPLRLTVDALHAEAVGDGERAEWVHVLAVPERLHTRLERILRSLPQPRHRLMLSMQAAATTVGRLRRQNSPDVSPEAGAEAGVEVEAPYTLAVGWYPTHVEFTVCRDKQWHFSHFTEAGAPADAAYYGLALLQRLHVDRADVGQLYVYGTALEPRAVPVFEKVFGRAPDLLNPLSVVDLDPGSLTADFDAEAYVPCMGAAL